jgi:hypothetical protein
VWSQKLNQQLITFTLTGVEHAQQVGGTNAAIYALEIRTDRAVINCSSPRNDFNLRWAASPAAKAECLKFTR